MPDTALYLVPLLGLLGLIFSLYLAYSTLKNDPGPPEIADISRAIRIGATAFMRREYRVMGLTALVFAFNYGTLWLKALLAGAHVGIFEIIGMRLRGVNPRVIVDSRIMVTKAGMPVCLLYTSPSPRDLSTSRMPSSA